MSVEANPFRFQHQSLNERTIAIRTLADLPQAVDYPLPWDIVPGWQRSHCKTNGARRRTDLPGNSAVSGNSTRRYLTYQGVDAIIKRTGGIMGHTVVTSPSQAITLLN
jgi:hypothetical protein